MLKDELCFECGQQAEHRHHIIPLSRGGTKTVPLCVACHSQVHDHSLSTSQLVKEGIARSRASGTPWGKKRRPEYAAAATLFEQGVRPAAVGKQLGLCKDAIMSIWRTWHRNK
jgi:5-methylcytosine-specific restriction endonuclease McrA